MGPELSACAVVGVKGGNTANTGETIVFGLDLAEDGPVNFAIPYDMLWPLVTNLLQLGNLATELREKNPLHKGGESAGYVFDLDALAISPSGKKRGWHVLRFDVRSSQGQLAKYLIAADRTRLENLADAIRQYLDQPYPPDQGSTIKH